MQRRLHQISLAVEYPRLSGLAVLDHVPINIESSGYGALLHQGIWLAVRQHLLPTRNKGARRSLRPPVGVKNAGMPLPAARILSANVPCGHSSTAIFPVRYWRSSFLFGPKNDMIIRSIWPFSVKRARPPRPSAPALLDTAVREWRDSGPRRCSAAISVAFGHNSLSVILPKRLSSDLV